MDPATLQELVERAAHLNLLALTGSASPHPPRTATGEGMAGFAAEAALHRFAIEMPSPAGGRVAAANRVGQKVGHLELCCKVIPERFRALPGREPPTTVLDRRRSQRLVLQQARFTVGGGSFEAFGTGRTFPMVMGGRPQLVVMLVGELTVTRGALAGLSGNLVLCGDLDADLRLTAHVMVRIGDLERRLQAGPAGIAALQPVAPDPLPGNSFLTWVAEKGPGGRHLNFASRDAGGRPRGFNIPVGLRQVQADFSTGGAAGLESRFHKGPEVGLEIGFGRETEPRTAAGGSSHTPFQFEGVSKYFFYQQQETVGTCTANFLEGRTFLVELPQAPQRPALRFGYFGTFVDGTGCFSGVRGLLYGLGRSVFDPTRPEEHVISNLYVARLDDPDGRFRRAPEAES